jgi:tyrosine-specific transport protein
LVVGVFVSFAGLLLPGLALVTDPLAVLSGGPSADMDVASSVLHMTPVFVTTLVYQNIVPTVTRILGYNRFKVITAITLGSLIPLLIYLAWCVAVLGGGIETTGGSLFTLFSMVTVAGSSIGALISLSEEVEILLQNPKKDTFSLPSVALPSIAALGACQLFADDISGALKVAGSYGSPLLYGVIPVAMAYLQQQRQQSQAMGVSPPRSPVMPGGLAGLGVLGLGATALVGTELFDTLGRAVG